MTSMKLISGPTRIRAAGNKTKIIEELVGRVNSQTSVLSIARMRSPAGWLEPGQRPEFDEYTMVLKGRLIVRSKSHMHIYPPKYPEPFEFTYQNRRKQR
jgi:hypothetical protein